MWTRGGAEPSPLHDERRKHVEHRPRHHLVLRKHAEDAEERLDASTLLKRITNEARAQRNVVRLFQHHCGEAVASRFHWYEHLVDSAPSSAKAWAQVLYQVDAWSTVDVAHARDLARVHTNDTVLHAATPVRDTVSNYGEVEAALRPTVA